MRANNLTPPNNPIRIGLNDQINYFYTGEMSKPGASSTLQRAKESLKVYQEQLAGYTKRLEAYREKIKSPEALAKLEKGVAKETRPIQRSIDRLEKFIADASLSIN